MKVKTSKKNNIVKYCTAIRVSQPTSSLEMTVKYNNLLQNKNFKETLKCSRVI